MGATAAIAMMAVGSGFSAMSSANAGKANQRLAEMNAQVAEIQAEDAIARGRVEEGIHRKKVRGMIGSQRAAFAAGGVDVNSGSALDVQADTAKFGEMDALTIRMTAAREAWGYKVGATDMRARGELANYQGKQQAIGTIVSAAGSMAGQKYGFKG
jgi:hypothetical protein